MRKKIQTEAVVSNLIRVKGETAKTGLGQSFDVGAFLCLTQHKINSAYGRH